MSLKIEDARQFSIVDLSKCTENSKFPLSDMDQINQNSPNSVKTCPSTNKLTPYSHSLVRVSSNRSLAIKNGVDFSRRSISGTGAHKGGEMGGAVDVETNSIGRTDSDVSMKQVVRYCWHQPAAFTTHATNKSDASIVSIADVNQVSSPGFQSGRILACCGDYIAYILQATDSYTVRVVNTRTGDRQLCKTVASSSVIDVVFSHHSSHHVYLAVIDSNKWVYVYDIHEVSSPSANGQNKQNRAGTANTSSLDNSLQMSLYIKFRAVDEHSMDSGGHGSVHTEEQSAVESGKISRHTQEEMRARRDCMLVWCPYIPGSSSNSSKDTFQPDDRDSLYGLLMVIHGSQAYLCNTHALRRTLCSQSADSDHTVSEDCSQMIQEGISGKDTSCVFLLEPHPGYILSACIAPDASAVATICSDGVVRFFSLDTIAAKCDTNLFSPLDAWRPCPVEEVFCRVSSLYFLDDHQEPDDGACFWKYALTGSSYNTVWKLWSCSDWVCLQTLSFVDSRLSLDAEDGVTDQLRRGCFRTNLSFCACLDLKAQNLLLCDNANLMLYVVSLNFNLNRDSIDNSQLPDIHKAHTVYMSHVTSYRLVNPIISLAIAHTYDIAMIEALKESSSRLKFFVIESRYLQECHVIVPSRTHSAVGLGNAIYTLNIRTEDLHTNIESDSTNVRNTECAQPKTSIQRPKHTKSEVPSISSSTAGHGHTHPIVSCAESHSLSPGATVSHRSHVTGVQVARDLYAKGTPENGSQCDGADTSLNSSKGCLIDAFRDKMSLNSPASSAIRSSTQIDSDRSSISKLLGDLIKKSSSNSGDTDTASGHQERAMHADEASTHEPQVCSMDQVEVFEDISLKQNSSQRLFGSLSSSSSSSGISFKNDTLLSPQSFTNLKFPNSSSVIEENIMSSLKNIELLPNHEDVSSDNVDELLASGDLFFNSSVLAQNPSSNRSIEDHQTNVITRRSENAVPISTEGIQQELSLNNSKFDELISLMRSSERKCEELNEKLNIQSRSIEKLMTNMNSVTAFVTDELKLHIADVIEHKLQKLLSTNLESIKSQTNSSLVDAINKLAKEFSSIVKDTTFKAINNKNFLSSLSHSLSGVFRDAFVSSIVPAFDKSLANLFEQINTAFIKGTQNYISQTETVQNVLRSEQEVRFSATLGRLDETGNTLETLKQSLETALQQFQQKQLHNVEEAATLRCDEINNITERFKEVITQSMRENIAILKKSLSVADVPITDQLAQLIEEKQYNEAFKKALSASDLSLVLFVCERVSSSQLFHTVPLVSEDSADSCPTQSVFGSRLEQPVLLALIQQLSADINTATQFKIRYLQDAITSVSLRHDTTQSHVRPVLRSVCDTLCQFVSQNSGHELLREVNLILFMVRSLIN